MLAGVRGRPDHEAERVTGAEAGRQFSDLTFGRGTDPVIISSIDIKD